MGAVEIPVGSLCGECCDDSFVICDRETPLIDRGEARTVGEEFRERDPILARSGELRPEVSHAGGERNSFFLQGMESHGGGHALAG